jgi:hypothetical protein
MNTQNTQKNFHSAPESSPRVETQTVAAGSITMERGVNHYTPFLSSGNNTWEFTTPTGRVDGFYTRAEAERCAQLTENQDREEAESGLGPIVAVLRKFFQIGKDGAR